MCPIASLIGRPRDAARDLAIQSAAVSLMQEVGYDKVTIDEIAHRAKVSKATVYRRWKNKQELITDLVKIHSKHEIPAIDTGSLRGDLIELISAHVAILKGPDGSLLMGLLTSAQRNPELSQLMMECKPKEVDPEVTEIVQRAMKRKEIVGVANLELLGEAVGAIIIHRIAITQQSVNRKFIESLVDDLLIPALTYKHS
jgi:AcrR family transcriptional regulator